MDAIHEINSGINNNNNGIEVPTQLPLGENHTTDTLKSVPIKDNPILYTVLPGRKSLTLARKYYHIHEVPNSDNHLFAVDNLYKKKHETKETNSKLFFRMNYVEFFTRLLSTPTNERIYYEYIDSSKRKIYFDIEWKHTNAERDAIIGNFDQLIRFTLFGISTELGNKNINYRPERDCYILPSHGPDKRSVHIIINNFCFDKCGVQNTSNVYYFAQAVRNYVPKELWHYTDAKGTHQTIDMGVYAAGKQFRLIWNTKINQNRFLDLDPNTCIEARFPTLPGDPVIMSEELQQLRLFEACMVSFTANCQLLPDWAPAVVENKIIKHVTTINDEQKAYMIEIFNTSEYADYWRPNENQTTDPNSIYLFPIHKPFHCPLCDKSHDNNNARLRLSKAGNIYIVCFSQAGTNKFKILGKDNTFEYDEYDDDDEDDNNNNNHVNGCTIWEDHNTNQYLVGLYRFQTAPEQFKQQQHQLERQQQKIEQQQQLEQLQQLQLTTHRQQRVQAQPIVNGVVPKQQNKTTDIQVHGTNEDTVSPTAVTDTFLVNAFTNEINNNNVVLTTHTIDGQLKISSIATTIASFLEDNTKFIGGGEYVIKDLYDAYERYRTGKGAKYNLLGGQFGREIKKLGHIIEQKRLVKGQNPVQVVKLQRPPIFTNTNTNPIEALAPLVQNTNAIITNSKLIEDKQRTDQQKNQPTQQQLQPGNRALDKHTDIRNFVDEYLTIDTESEVDVDNLNICMDEYCENNIINRKGFGKGRLIQFLTKYMRMEIIGDAVKGYKCKDDKLAAKNREVEKSYRRIWQWNNQQYQIGCHNGKTRDRYCKLDTPEWQNINVIYRNDEVVSPIDSLIELTAAYENGLSGQTKEIISEIKHRKLLHRQTEIDIERHWKRILYMEFSRTPGAKQLTDRVERFQEYCESDAAINVLDADDEYQLLLQRNIEQSETILRLSESIQNEITMVKNNAEWCIAVRSTFATQKTVNLLPYISANPDMKVLIILPRITLTNDYNETYRQLGFSVYTENIDEGEIRGDRIIVCYPSLYRVKGLFGLVVLDEYKIIKDLQHTLVRKNKKEHRCYQALKQYVQYSERVYVADALLTNAHVLELSKMRQAGENRTPITVYQNFYKKHCNNVVYTVSDRDLLTHKIQQDLEDEKTTVIPTNSKKYANFIHKDVSKKYPNIPTCISTSDNKADVPIHQLWSNKKLITYTPTVLAGNSFTEPVDAVYGYFTPESCDPGDALQMMMRCRNNTSNNYYLYVENRNINRVIPDNIPATFNDIKEYLSRRDVIIRMQSPNIPEEFRLPMDMIEFNHINETIKINDPYFDSYVNFIKQNVVKQREYLFRLLLYMRDAGFQYGGNIYTSTQEKQAVKAIRTDRLIYRAGQKHDEINNICRADDIITSEYQNLSKKMSPTQENINEMKKYRLRHLYRVDNVPKWFVKATKGKHTKYLNIRRFRQVNGITNNTERNNLMGIIGNEMMNNKDEEELNMSQYIRETNIGSEIVTCYHAINILVIIGTHEFLRSYYKYEGSPIVDVMPTITRYLHTHNEQIKVIFKTTVDDSIKLASKITNKAFGINIKGNGGRILVENSWILHNDVIQPVNLDLYDREELKPLPDKQVLLERYYQGKQLKLMMWNQTVINRIIATK